MRSSSSISSGSRWDSSIEHRILLLAVLPYRNRAASEGSSEMLWDGVRERGVFDGPMRGELKGMGED